MLIVEDDGVAALLLERIVADMGHEPLRAATGAEALRLVERSDVDLVLLDLGLPDQDGLVVARRLRDRWPADVMPIVFVTGEHDPEMRVKGLEAGGADYITKPYHVPEVRARVHHQLEMLAMRRQLAAAARVLEQRVDERTAELRDEIDRRRRLEDELRRLAQTDPVTGALNQRGLVPELDRWRAEGDGGLIVAVEIDGWESITGVMGQRHADRLLTSVAARFPSASPVARLGAALFVTGLSTLGGEASRALADLRQHLEPPVVVDGRSTYLTYTIGAVAHDGAERSASTAELIRDATLALHAAKQHPGSTEVLGAARRAELSDQLDLEQQLWGAAERGELRLQYQPIFDAETLRPDGFEALVRWAHPARGVVAPGVFVPLAERSGAIVEIGWWTAVEATGQLARWIDTGAVDRDATMAINISTVEAVDLELPRRLLRAVTDAGLEPASIDVELTETAMVRHESTVRRILSELRAAGMGVCLDDFGTGSSSLTLLQQMPADVVKIDRSFVHDITGDVASAAIVESTIGLAHRLGRRVVAEGIETVDQLEMVRELGCDHLQGWLLARPLDPADAVVARAEVLSTPTGAA